MRHDVTRDDRAGHTGAAYGQVGATLLEFAVVASPLGVLAVTLMLTLLNAQELAATRAMEATVTNMLAGLRAQASALLMAERSVEITARAAGNPVQWLDAPPANYLGGYREIPVGNSGGAWYSDSMLGKLICTAYLRPHFAPSPTSDYAEWLEVLPVSAAEGGVAA